MAIEVDFGMIPPYLYEQPPQDLGSAASKFLGLLYTDADWIVVQRELEQLSRDNSIEGILRRQALHAALQGITNAVARGLSDEESWAAVQKAREEAERSLAAELEAAEEELRARAPEIAKKLPEIAKAAEKTPPDSPLAQAAARITRVVGRAHLSKLGPYWTLVVLYFLIVHLTVGDIAALTLWYMVASEQFTKKD
jgi:hypothetical protein